MNFVTSISLVVLGAMFLALLGWGSIRAAWRNCEGRRGVFAALAILAAVCSIVAQKPSPDTPTITVDALLRDVGCYATNNVFHAAVTNAPSYAGVDFSDCDLMVYARERASSDAASWFELTPRKKFSQQPADYAIENATNFNYMVYLNYVPPSPVHTNGVFELYGFVIENEAQGEPDQLAAGFINSRAVTISDLPYDSEVEYLESTGTQWIDTGMVLSSDGFAYDVDVTFASTANCQVFGGRTQAVNSSHDSIVLFVVRGYWRFDYFGDWKAGTAVAANTRYSVSYANGRTTVNGVSTSTSVSSGRQSGATVYVFAGHRPASTGGVEFPSSMKLYSLKFYQNGVLAADYQPVRKAGIGYLYDRVSGELFGNAGTGVFGYGNDK